MSKTQPYGADRCPNCGEYGSHYCGPSFGEEGFFICKKKEQRRINGLVDQFEGEEDQQIRDS